MNYNPKIFRKNDIRGIYKKDFDLEFVQKLTQAFIIYSQKKINAGQDFKIALGHDCRLSSPEIANCMAEALSSLGVQVHFLGMVPSPLCFFTSHFFSDIQASIMITASHNPAGYNGFKFQLNKESISDKKLLEVQEIFDNQIEKKSSHSLKPTQTQAVLLQSADSKEKQKFKKQNNFRTQHEAETNYINLLKEKFSFSAHDQVIKKIAVDCGNGASGPLVRKVCEALNLPIHYLYDEPNGHFPNHHPDPSLEENLKVLQQTVVKENCAFGAAFDGDGDRLVIVDKSGRTLHGDELMAIFIADMAARSTLKAVVVDVKCADWFFDFLEKMKIKAIVWKSGHALIRQKTLEEEVDFGGELSGHFFFQADFFSIDDGLYTLLRLIKILANSRKSLEQLIPQEDSINTYEMRIPIENKDHIMKKLQSIKKYYKNQPFARCLFIDGIRVSLEEAWGLVRFSNTQSEMTLRFGGKTKSDLQDIQRTFHKLLGLPQR